MHLKNDFIHVDQVSTRKPSSRKVWFSLGQTQAHGTVICENTSTNALTFPTTNLLQLLIQHLLIFSGPT